MKKILAVFISGILFFLLAACGKDGGESTEVYPSDIIETDVRETRTLEYGTDRKTITVYKPDGATFSTPDIDVTDIISIADDDTAWKIDVCGAVAYLYDAGEPFVYYYYKDVLDEYYRNEITYFTQEVKDLGIEFEGKPVKKIISQYIKNGEDKTETDIFTGFEFEDTRNGKYYGDGLLGFHISMYDELPSDEELVRIFSEVFGTDIE